MRSRSDGVNCYIRYFLLYFSFVFLEKNLLLAKRSDCSNELLIDNWTQWNIWMHDVVEECVYVCVCATKPFLTVVWITSEVRLMRLTDGNGCALLSFSLTLEIEHIQHTCTLAIIWSSYEHTNTNQRLPCRGFSPERIVWVYTSSWNDYVLHNWVHDNRACSCGEKKWLNVER